MKEWTLTLLRDLPLWEFKSQWTFESSKSDFRGQNLMDWRVHYTSKKFLKPKCLKWSCITHLDIKNISYGQNKGRESNWQFNFRPLKVKNRQYFLTCRWHATYHWNALDEGYNFILDLISIEGLHAKLWCPKVGKLRESQLWQFWDSQMGVLRQNAIWMWALWRSTKYTIRGKVVASLSLGRGESCEFELSVVRPNTKSAPTMH